MMAISIIFQNAVKETQFKYVKLEGGYCFHEK